MTTPEGDVGSQSAQFTVTMSAPSGQTVTVNYATADGTATSPADYSSASGTLTFLPGDVSKTFTVAVNGDLLDEADEIYTVTLSGSANATISDGTGQGTISDDDAVLYPAGDINCSGATTSSDIIYLVNYVFKGGTIPCK